jgi:hypothetical protein
MNAPIPRIVTLLARHGDEKYRDALPDIRTLFAQQMPEFAHEVVVIDNALDPERTERLGPGTALIGGDNAAWEFSAWDRGIGHLGQCLDDYDFVHLATSAFRKLYTRYLDRFDADMLGLVAGRAAAVGHIDYFNEPVAFAGRSLQSWLRSSFVLLPPAELRLLGPLVSVTDRSGLFSGDPAAPFRIDAPLSASYRQNILGWLTGGGTGQGTEWHSRFALSEQTLRFFEDKAVAILNEQMLTSRLRAQGCAIVDATWLATRAGQSYPAARPLGAIPDWRVQVTSRDVDSAGPALLP